MRIIKIKLYKINELPVKVRKKIIDEHRDINVNYDWWEPELDYFIEQLRKYGLEAGMKDFEFDLYRNTFNIKKLRTVNMNKLLNKFPLELRSKLIAKSLKGNEDITDIINVYYDSNGPHCELLNESAVVAYNDMIEVESALGAIIKSLFHKFLKQLDEQYEDLTSDKAITETLEANEYEFTREGKTL